MAFLLPPLFSPVQLTSVFSVENCLAGFSDHFTITSREEALSLCPLQLCSSLPAAVHILCFFSHRGPEVLQILVPLQQRQWAATRVCWKKHHNEKGAKAHSTWSRIRANRLQTFYDKLNLCARYSTARMDWSSLVCCLVSSLVFFCHSKIYCRWPNLLTQKQCWLHSGEWLGPLRMRKQQHRSVSSNRKLVSPGFVGVLMKTEIRTLHRNGNLFRPNP